MTSATTNFKSRWDALRASEKKPCPKCGTPSHKRGRVALVVQEWRCPNGHKWRESPPQTKSHTSHLGGQGDPKPLCKDGTMGHVWQIAEGPSGYGRCGRCHQIHYFDAIGEGWTENFRTFRPKQTPLEEEDDAELQ